jgi:hypothetical protein
MDLYRMNRIAITDLLWGFAFLMVFLMAVHFSRGGGHSAYKNTFDPLVVITGVVLLFLTGDRISGILTGYTPRRGKSSGTPRKTPRN